MTPNMAIIIDTTPFWQGQFAQKTLGIEAKPMSALFADPAIQVKFLVDTLEGKEPLDRTSLFCVGPLGDVWQQEPKRVLRKYDLTEINSEGWLKFTPKPDNKVEYFRVTPEFYGDNVNDKCYIIGMYGETLGNIANCQLVKLGDVVARQTYDHTDQWVVAKRIWDNSYTDTAA